MFSLRLGQLVLTPEFIAALIVGLGGSLWLLTLTTAGQREDVVGDYVVLVGALVGVVLAAMGLVIALMTDAYLRVLREAPDGVSTFLRPFILAIGVQIGTVIGAVVYRAANSEVPVRVEQVAFCVLSFLFIYGALEVVAIARNLHAHALLRAKQAETDDVEGRLRVLRERTPGK